VNDALKLRAEICVACPVARNHVSATRLGHASPAPTANIYADIGFEDMQERIEWAVSIEKPH
jgi:hypothetical protein